MQRKNYSSLSLILILSSIIIIYIARADIHSVVSNIFTLDTREGELIPLEHSALSNIFILDTQEVPLAKDLKHSALSNIFTLDTRKLTLKVVELDSNPNPEISQAMEGSVTYQYYQVVDNNGKGVSDMKPVLEINGKTIIGDPSDEHGLLKLSIDTKNIAKAGDILTVKLVKIGEQELLPSEQITFQVQVMPAKSKVISDK